MMKQALHSKLGELESALGIGNVQEMFEEWQATGGLSLSGIGGGGGATIDLEAGKQVRTYETRSAFSNRMSNYTRKIFMT